MKKYIFVLNAIELMTKLYVGKRVEGVLFMDENTGRLTFKAYNRKPRGSQDRLICPLESGWLKETPKRYRFLSSVKKTLDRRWVNIAMHRDLKQAMDALEIREIVERV